MLITFLSHSRMNRVAQIPINVKRCYFKRIWRAPQMITSIVRYVICIDIDKI